jgi:hypothetical protein
MSAVGVGEPDRPADPGVIAVILGKRGRHAPLAEIDLDQHVRVWRIGWSDDGIAHVERRMRPGRLCQILDGRRQPVAAGDEQHVRRAQAAPEGCRVRRYKRLVPGDLLPQPRAKLSAEPVQRGVDCGCHGPPRFFSIER